MRDLTGARWRKSSYSNANSANCIEVARNLPGRVAVRDSTDPEGPALSFAPGSWQMFTSSVKRAVTGRA